jgi:hypothetical protein
MRGLDHIVNAELTGPLVASWFTSLEAAVRQALARWAVNQIDFETGLLRDTWVRLDDPAIRSVAIASDPRLCSEVAEILVPEKRGGQHIALEQAAQQNGMSGKQSRSRLHDSIQKLLPSWLTRPEIALLLGADPFRTGWAFIANEIGRRTHAQYMAWRAAGASGEWRLINHLLLAEYFCQCRYSQAVHVAEELDNDARSGILSIRGVLVNTARWVGPSSVAEAAIPVSGFYGGAVLAHRDRSDLIASVHRESAATAAGDGIIERLLGHHTQDVPERVRSGEVSSANWLGNRRLRYTQFESSLLAYVAVAAIEQLTRGLARHQGLNTIKPNGAPAGIPSVLQDHANLALPARLADRITMIFDSNKGNIRNRIMHGAFMLTNSKRLQANMLAAGRAIPDAPPHQDPYTPENIARLTLETLQYLDRAIPAIANLTAGDLDWGAGSRLNGADLNHRAQSCSCL